MDRRDTLRHKALQDLQGLHVLMLDGHFDFGNGYHGKVYLNPHQLFRQPATIWRFAQDLLDVLPAWASGVSRCCSTSRRAGTKTVRFGSSGWMNLRPCWSSWNEPPRPVDIC